MDIDEKVLEEFEWRDRRNDAVVEATRLANEGVAEGYNEPISEGAVFLPPPEPEQRLPKSGLSEEELKSQGIPTYYGRLVQRLKGRKITQDFPPCHAVEYNEPRDGSGVKVTLIGTKYSFILDKPGDIFYCMAKEGTGWKNVNVKSYDRYKEECEKENKKGKRRKVEDGEEENATEPTSKLKSVKRRA